MTLAYGYAKAKVLSVSKPVPSKHGHEIQYHLHTALRIGDQQWDAAINVGTNDADDLLKYKLIFDFRHPIIDVLRAANDDTRNLTEVHQLPALDFQRSNLLDGTGKWRDSDVMDGSDANEPTASLMRLLLKAKTEDLDVYLFGRFYTDGNGLHDIHMNQGSKTRFLHQEGDDSNDHNDIWQDGAVLIDMGIDLWAGYFSAFEQQRIPTDDLGNPKPEAKAIA